MLKNWKKCIPHSLHACLTKAAFPVTEWNNNTVAHSVQYLIVALWLSLLLVLILYIVMIFNVYHFWKNVDCAVPCLYAGSCLLILVIIPLESISKSSCDWPIARVFASLFMHIDQMSNSAFSRTYPCHKQCILCGDFLRKRWKFLIFHSSKVILFWHLNNLELQ